MVSCFYRSSEGRIFNNLQTAMQAAVVNACDKAIFVSERSAKSCAVVLGLPPLKVTYIPNGYDGDDFSDIDVNTLDNIPFDKIHIKHNGKFYHSFREPYTLIQSVNELIDSNDLTSDEIDIEFVGEENTVIINRIRELDRHGVVTVTPHMSHVDSIKNMTGANLLFLPIGRGDGVRDFYTGKVFEYIKMKRKILALAPTDSLIRELLDETGTGVVIEMDDIDGIKAFLLEFHRELRAGKVAVNENVDETVKYSRRNLTAKLAGVFGSL